MPVLGENLGELSSGRYRFTRGTNYDGAVIRRLNIWKKGAGRYFRFSIPLLIALSFGCAARTPVDEYSLRIGGFQREYLLYVPKQARKFKGKRPLVWVLHGGGGSADFAVRNTRGRFNELADRDGFYVVYPNAYNKMWDFGEGEVSEQLETRVDDLGYFKRLIETLLSKYPIDPQRIFATGISRGGQASYFLACKVGGFRAIAPVAMPLPEYLKDDCEEGPPVGLAILNGTSDPIVPYAGGLIKVFKKERGTVLSTRDTVDLWRARNGCSGATASGMQTIDPVEDETSVKKTTWRDGCPSTPVVLYRIEGGGHTWPSGTQYLPSFTVGKVTKDIDGAIEVWRFIQEFK
jgi:polyhydroxybutyrate depolymerase